MSERAGELLPDDSVDVPTYHHQAVDRLGQGLSVSAWAEDGTVEAIEGAGFTLGVQWHPEQGDDLRLMTAPEEWSSMIPWVGR